MLSRSLLYLLSLAYTPPLESANPALVARTLVTNSIVRRNRDEPQLRLGKRTHTTTNDRGHRSDARADDDIARSSALDDNDEWRRAPPDGRGSDDDGWSSDDEWRRAPPDGRGSDDDGWSSDDEWRRAPPDGWSSERAMDRARTELRSRDGAHTRSSRRRSSPGRAVVTSTDAGTLKISIPPSGFGADSLFAGTFAVGWMSVVVRATLAAAGAAGGLSTLLFLLPFWGAGGLVAKQAVVDPLISASITIGEFAWSVVVSVGGVSLWRQEGSTDELSGAASAVVAYVNGDPVVELQLLRRGSSPVRLGGLKLNEDEVECLARAIEARLDEIDALPEAIDS